MGLFAFPKEGQHEEQQEEHCNRGSSVLAGWEVPGVSTKQEAGRNEGCSLMGCYVNSRCLWKLGRILEVMNILHGLQFPPLQFWKSIASRGNGDPWEEVCFCEAWPMFCGRRAVLFGKHPSRENHKWQGCLDQSGRCKQITRVKQKKRKKV